MSVTNFSQWAKSAGPGKPSEGKLTEVEFAVAREMVVGLKREFPVLAPALDEVLLSLARAYYPGCSVPTCIVCISPDAATHRVLSQIIDGEPVEDSTPVLVAVVKHLLAPQPLRGYSPALPKANILINELNGLEKARLKDMANALLSLLNQPDPPPVQPAA